MTEWHEMTALELGRGVKAGEIDPVALADHFLDRIEAADPDRRTFVSLTRERAYGEAIAARRRAAAGMVLSPLDGVPIGWKDLFDTANHPTEGASALFAGRVPDRDAEPLRRATAAGAVCLGKTNLPDLAYSGLGVNPHTGTPANPHSPQGDPRVPGGSSAGAGTSVAAGLAPAGIGSDTGGSVRIPAAFNGITGLKTTWGAISLEGAIPLAPSLDTVGPLTRDVADANALFSIMSGRPMADLGGVNPSHLRLLWARGHDENELEPGVADAIEAAVEALRRTGATVDEARLDSYEAVDDLVIQHGNPITLEGWALWGETVEANPGKLYKPIRDRISAGRDASAVDAEIMRRRFPDLARVWRREAAGYDAVIQSTTPVVAPSIAEVSADEARHSRFALLSSFNTRRINFLGLCALSLPCGWSEGLPVGLMATAGANGEGGLLRTGKAIEAVCTELFSR
ncbi:MAG: amidase [Minwuia sp.]|uniref:amidase n=1 Tax=Minwuia sp. TaxID=2493630 RepID=UPI003A841204